MLVSSRRCRGVRPFPAHVFLSHLVVLKPCNRFYTLCPLAAQQRVFVPPCVCDVGGL